jgi:hypothetical protein
LPSQAAAVADTGDALADSEAAGCSGGRAGLAMPLPIALEEAASLNGKRIAKVR